MSEEFLKEEIEQLEEEYGTDTEHWDEEHLIRVITEILDPVDAYVASVGGPEGPWHYKSLTIRRRMNSITVHDVDGKCCDIIRVENIVMVEDVHEFLRDYLDELNEDTLAEL